MEVRKISRRRPYSVDEAQLQAVVLQRTEMYKNFCYTFQLKYVFRLEENMSRAVGQNPLARTKLTNSLGKQQLELSTRT